MQSIKFSFDGIIYPVMYIYTNRYFLFILFFKLFNKIYTFYTLSPSFYGQCAYTRSVYPYKPPANLLFAIHGKRSHVGLGCPALGVIVPLVYSSAAILRVPHGVAFGLIKVLLQLAVGDRDLFHDGNCLPRHVYCRLFIHSSHPLANTVTHAELSTPRGVRVSPHPHGHVSGIQVVFVFLQKKEQRRLQRHLVAEHHAWVVQVDVLGLRGDHGGRAPAGLALLGCLCQLRRFPFHLQQLLDHLLKRVCERGQVSVLARPATALWSPVASCRRRRSSAQVAFRPMAPHARGISQGRSSHATEVWNNHSKEQDGHHSSNLVELEGETQKTSRGEKQSREGAEESRVNERGLLSKLDFTWSTMHDCSHSLTHTHTHTPLFLCEPKAFKDL